MFEPYIVPFNTTPKFLLWDKAYPERISIITEKCNTPRTAPTNTRAVAISCDDHKLVILTVKPTVKIPQIVVRKYIYSVCWTDIFVDYLTTREEYRKHELVFRSSTQLPPHMVILRENYTDFALVAFSDGRVERVNLT
jgi:hypothetical protein